MEKDVLDFNKFSDGLVKAWKHAKSYPYVCCCPGCKEKAIKSHLLLQHPLLESICDEKNSLLQMVDNDIDPRSGNWSFYSKRKVGITNALQCKLFCKKHDDLLFKDIEIQNSIPKTKHDCLLLAFRSACAVRHQEEHRLRVYEYQYKTDGQKNLMEDNSRLYIKIMDAVINNLWEAINGNGDGYYEFRLIVMTKVDVAASDCIIDDDDFEKHILEDDYEEPLSCLFINFIPLEDKSYLLLGCDTRYDKNEEYTSIIEKFPTGDVSLDYHLKTIKGVLLKCTNWCCSPKLYADSAWKKFIDEYEILKVSSILG